MEQSASCWKGLTALSSRLSGGPEARRLSMRSVVAPSSPSSTRRDGTGRCKKRAADCQMCRCATSRQSRRHGSGGGCRRRVARHPTRLRSRCSFQIWIYPGYRRSPPGYAHSRLPGGAVSRSWAPNRTSARVRSAMTLRAVSPRPAQRSARIPGAQCPQTPNML